MWHFDGGAWSQAQRGGPARFGDRVPEDVWAGSWHFDGISWKSQFLAPNINIFAVSGTGPDDVWIGGALNDAADQGVLFHRHPGDPAAACGNFRVDPGEQCDPPQANICDATCQAIVICGNGVVDPGEQCDPPTARRPFRAAIPAARSRSAETDSSIRVSSATRPIVAAFPGFAI